MTIVEGTILHGPEFEPIEGRVVIGDDGKIDAVEEGSARSDDIVIPAFVNAHTHIGDSIAKDVGEGMTLKELVAPPAGLKHRLLAAADRDEQVEAIQRSLSLMVKGGTTAFLDFREGGVEGVKLLYDAVEEFPLSAYALGRETIAAMEASDGFGASSTNDGEFSSERAATREAGKLFGIHAGEADSSDINGGLDLDPDFLVHVVHPEAIHLERIEDREVPIVICPRSNLVTGVGHPPVRELLDRTTVALGTDNVMLNNPDMFREMEFVAKMTDVSAREVLRMATRSGAEIADLNCGLIEPERKARLVVLNGDSDNLAGTKNPVRAVVRRAGIGDISETILEPGCGTK